VKARDLELARQIMRDISSRSSRPIRLMEFCGGHTVAILKHGLRQLLPRRVTLFSGPGCPVCVTATGDIDKIIALAGLPGTIIASFGDLIRVPGSNSSLQQARAGGADVRIVYSALEALDLARQNPARKVVMVGIGFETTAPTIAASVLQAREQGLKNYSILSLHKLTPPVMKAILDAGEARIDGIVCPGHVCAITGSLPYEFIARDYGIACVVSGFEAVDILVCIDMLVRQIESGRPKVEIAYRRAVRPEGNRHALEMLDQVFDVTSADWRGVGLVPRSGLRLKPAYAAFDAERVFNIPEIPVREPEGCLCGEILRGLKTPADCPLFKIACTPEHPVGPCMVSSEGACSAFNLYGEQEEDR
jgi:hydrogenase expression/formation protein HypD